MTEKLCFYGGIWQDFGKISVDKNRVLLYYIYWRVRVHLLVRIGALFF